MPEFDALFAFYALLLGLAVANVATAFAEMYKVRGRVVIGWTVPLLGVVVLTAACQQWLSLFRAQADMKLGPGELLICLAMALPYIFISQVIRPRHDETASLEAYYAEHRRVLAGALLVPVLASSIVNVIYAVALKEGLAMAALGFLIYQGVRYACIIPMLIWPNVAVQRAGLIVLLAHTVLMMF
ncbi:MULTISPECIES: hypothetical protein [unclassified Brevundimonas]|uniref:hypothetical protein n=1 Tax=unclassified Brevundimonas TaxID=2622653 RepID=UPI0025C22332|nr:MULTISPECIES: hypothetical protein [unclassified Brevundimonas]